MAAITLAEVKKFLQIDHDAEDAYLELLIDAAITNCEAKTGLALSVQSGQYDPSMALDAPKPLYPYTVANVDGIPTYTTAITDKLPALKPSMFLYIQSLYETDPKTVQLALDASDRLARLHRHDWGF